MTADLLMLASIVYGWWWLRRPRYTPKEAYQRYLQSPGWRWTKAIRKQKRCVKCKATTNLQLHHLSYFWHNVMFFREYVPNLLDPMETLCRTHHAAQHGKD